MRILVLSDTHIPGRARALPPIVYEALERADLILHAGDIAGAELLAELELFAPVYAVAGNMDPPDLRERLPHRLVVEAGGRRIGLIHGDGHDSRRTSERTLYAFRDGDVDCVIFGHSHQPFHEWRNGILLFNPGSPTDRRREQRHSFGWLFPGWSGEAIRAEHVFFA